MESFVRRVNSSIYGVLCAVSFASCEQPELGQARTHASRARFHFVFRWRGVGKKGEGSRRKKCCFYRVPFFVSIYLLVGTTVPATPSNAPSRVTRVYF